MAYFISYKDLTDILKSNELGIQKLRDIALYKLTIMRLELERFESTVSKIVQYIKTNSPIQQSRIRKKNTLASIVKLGIKNLLKQTHPMKIVKENEVNVKEVEDLFVNHVLRLIDSGKDGEVKNNTVSEFGKDTPPATNLNTQVKIAKIVDKTIPEEKEAPIKLPTFESKRARIFEPEPEHLYAMYPAKKAHIKSNTFTEPQKKKIPLFKAHNNFQKMHYETPKDLQHILTSQRSILKSSNSSDSLTDPNPETLNHDLDLPSFDESGIGGHKRSVTSNPGDFLRDLIPMKKRNQERTPPELVNLPVITESAPDETPLLQNRPMSTQSAAPNPASSVNTMVDIEGMLHNYFAMDIKGIKDLFMIKATSNYVSDQEFHNCLLEYLEHKDIKDMDLDNIAHLSDDEQRDKKQPKLDDADLGRYYLDPGDVSIDSIDYPTECFSHHNPKPSDFITNHSNPHTGRGPYRTSAPASMQIMPPLEEVDLEWAIEFLEVSAPLI